MTRIFLPPEELTSDEISITGENARHLSLVLRVQQGDSIIIFDGRGFKYECTLESVHKKEIIAKLKNKAPYSIESPLSLILAQGLPKGEKMDHIVQKAAELGVRRIIPLVTERSQIRHTHKVDRWRKIALAASQQSGRDRVTNIDDPVNFRDFIAVKSRSSADACFGDIKEMKQAPGTCIMFSEGQSQRNFKQVLTHLKHIRKITLLVGPEGGFSHEEVSAASDRGIHEVSLGPRILRTETAPIAAISIIQYELGDMG